MDRAERTGLGVAVVGHILLFGALSLGLVTTARLPPIKPEPIDVTLVDAIGLRSAAPEAAPAPPAPSEAPEVAKPEEPPPAPEPVAAPKPEPAPPPEPTPAPAKPAPKPKPTPPKPTPKPAPPAPKPAPKPVPKPEPKPKPAPKPAPAAKPQPAAKAEPKAADERGRRRPDKPSQAAGASDAVRDKAGKPAKPAKPGTKAAGSRLGPDFLKGLTPEKSSGKAEKPAAAAVSATALTGLAAAIKRQVEPCYELGSLQGTPAMSIVTVLRLRFNKDGTIATAPTVSEQTGVNAGNSAYKQQIAEVGRRAVLRCAPLRLPPDLYTGGWEDIELRFIPGQMG